MSWIIRNKATGQAIMETFNERLLAMLNTKKYEAVLVMQHLCDLNDQSTLASQWMRCGKSR